MAEEVSNVPSKGAEQTPSKKKRKPSKTSSTPKPKIKDMVEEAISMTYVDRNGASLQAIKKFLFANYGLDKHATYIRNALKKGVASGDFIQLKGVGANGSFKLNSAATTKPAEKTRRQKDSDKAKMEKDAKSEQEALRLAKKVKKAKKERLAKKDPTPSPKSVKKVRKSKPEKKVKTHKKLQKKKSVKKSPKKAKKGSTKWPGTAQHGLYF